MPYTPHCHPEWSVSEIEGSGWCKSKGTKNALNALNHSRFFDCAQNDNKDEAFGKARVRAESKTTKVKKITEM